MERTPGGDVTDQHGADSFATRAATDGAGAVDEDYGVFLRSAEHVLDGVERALAQLDEGTYGTCTVCSGPIGEADLEADPTADRCAAHRTST